MTWERTVLGTRAQPRFGSAWSTVLLAVFGLLFVLIGWIVLAVIVWLLAGASFVIWRMR
jgi:hypothetical protein